MAEIATEYKDNGNLSIFEFLSASDASNISDCHASFTSHTIQIGRKRLHDKAK